MVGCGGLDERRKSQHRAVQTILYADQERPRREPVAQHQQFLDAFRIRDDGLRAAVVQAVFDRVRPKEREQRQGNRAEPVCREMDDQCFRTLRQQNADAVAAHNTLRSQRIGKPPRTLLEILESEFGGMSFRRFIDQRRSTRADVAIAYRLRDVEGGWYGPGKGLANFPV